MYTSDGFKSDLQRHLANIQRPYNGGPYHGYDESEMLIEACESARYELFQKSELLGWNAAQVEFEHCNDSSAFAMIELLKKWIHQCDGASANTGKSEPVANAALQVVRNASLTKAVLTVEKYSELAIAIHEQGQYWGITPCPDLRSLFVLDRAIQLDLKGKQWTGLLRLLSESSDGRHAKNEDVMLTFKYELSGNLSVKDANVDELRNIRGRLSKSIANLSRRFRELVISNDPTGPPVLSTAEPGIVRSQFTVRCLVKDGMNRLRFGEVPYEGSH